MGPHIDMKSECDERKISDTNCFEYGDAHDMWGNGDVTIQTRKKKKKKTFLVVFVVCARPIIASEDESHSMLN